MRVAFDRQIFCLQRTGGISRYFVELIRALPSAGVEPVLPFRWVANEPALAALSAVKDVGSVRAGRALLTAEAHRPRWSRRSGLPIDVVHHTFYDPRFLTKPPGVPTVVTVHDMIPELFADSVPAGVHLAKERYVREADVVVVVSEATRRDVLNQYPGLEIPVVPIPHGVSAPFRPGGPRLPTLPDQYLLYVGRRGGYKDFSVALAGFRCTAGSHPNLHFVCVGGGTWSPVEAESLGDLSSRVHRVDLDDAGLARAYSNAAAFVFPSRYEGFGLPLLEAMACGTPVVAANAASLPEVGGDAAVYFPPGDETALAETLDALLSDPVRRAQAVARGLDRAAEFTWQRTAELTAAAYRSVTPRSLR